MIATGAILAVAVGIATIVGAIAAVGGGIWVNSKRFRPAFEAEIDAHAQAIRLSVVNRGRKPGLINKVAVVRSDMELPAKFPGLPSSAFCPAKFGHKEKRELIITAEKDEGPFPEEACVLVRWGDGKERLLHPVRATGVTFYGETSNWPRCVG